VHLHRIEFDFGRPQESLNSPRRMTEIKFNRGTYVGTAEGAHGVFTNSNGTVYAGEIADGSACVGVVTYTDGLTYFVECDADGKTHGRALGCNADGDTGYCRYEHGSEKEHAALCADGTCEYNGKACRADYAPFVALRAMVVPIKARPPLVPPQPPLCRIRFHGPPIGPTGHCFGTRRNSRRPTPTRCALAASASSLHGPRVTLHSSCQTNAPRVRPGRRTGPEGCTTHATQTTCVVHPSRRPVHAVQLTPMRSALIIIMPHALVERCGLRRAATLGCTPNIPHAHRQCASPFRTAHLHSGPIARTKF
jgi:hypothetical protein